MINRSDGQTYHLSLFSGPDPSPYISTNGCAKHVICTFGYVHDRIGPKRNSLVVFIALVNDGHKYLVQQLENTADKIAGLVQAGYELEPAYTFRGGLLSSGPPKYHELGALVGTPNNEESLPCSPP